MLESELGFGLGLGLGLELELELELIVPIELVALGAAFKALGFLMVVAEPVGRSLEVCGMVVETLLCPTDAKPDRVIVAEDVGAPAFVVVMIDETTGARCVGGFKAVEGLTRADGRAGMRDEGILEVDPGMAS